MTEQALPEALESVLVAGGDPETVFGALLPALCEVLQCDRCFLYLRNPETRVGKKAFCWRRNPQVPDATDLDWQQEPESLTTEDPLFAAALRTDPSVYVEDVETAGPDVLNLAFERQYFGHRALIHAHLCQDGQMWGVLQPCVFGAPRVWTEFDRSVIAQLEQSLTPLAIAYVQAAAI